MVLSSSVCTPHGDRRAWRRAEAVVHVIILTEKTPRLERRSGERFLRLLRAHVASCRWFAYSCGSFLAMKRPSGTSLCIEGAFHALESVSMSVLYLKVLTRTTKLLVRPGHACIGDSRHRVDAKIYVAGDDARHRRWKCHSSRRRSWASGETMTHGVVLADCMKPDYGHLIDWQPGGAGSKKLQRR